MQKKELLNGYLLNKIIDRSNEFCVCVNVIRHGERIERPNITGPNISGESVCGIIPIYLRIIFFVLQLQ